MNLEPNFPSAIPLTEEELAEVLTEFHRRGRSEVKHLAPPPPFEVTSSIVQTTSSRPPPVPREDPELVVQPQVLAIEEKYYEFLPSFYYGSTDGTTHSSLGWNFRCVTAGSVAHESYIRMYGGGFWQSVNPPGWRGPITGYVFNQSSWFPPAYNEVGAWVTLDVYYGGIPNPNDQQLLEIHAYFACWIEEVGNPQNVSEEIYPAYSIFAWNWYRANKGIGFDITFHNFLP